MGNETTTYLLLVLSDQNVFVVDHHLLQEHLRAGNVLHRQTLLIVFIVQIQLLGLQSLLTKYAGRVPIVFLAEMVALKRSLLLQGVVKRS